MTLTQWMILPLRRYTDFRGRSCRAEYWWFMLFGIIAAIVASTFDWLIFGPAVVTRHATMLGGVPVTVTQSSTRFIGTALSLALLCPQVAVGIRRIHDLDHTGWWAALPSCWRRWPAAASPPAACSISADSPALSLS